MLHILGLVGKGIGIALLCILILVVALLLALLFVPIRYYVTGKLEQGKADGKAKLHWLFHIVTASAVWEQKPRYIIRIFGIPIYDNIRKAEKTKKKKPIKQKQKKKKKAKQLKEPKIPEKPKLLQPEPVSKTEPETRMVEPKLVSRPEPMKQPENVNKPESVEQPETVSKLKRFWNKIKAFFEMLLSLMKKIWNVPHAITEKLQSIQNKINDWKSTIDSYRAFIEREDFKRAFALCKKQLLCVWKNIRPQKLKADIHFGFDDPATTGQILAYLGMLYSVLGKDIRIRPDFEKTIIEGKVLVKGRVTLFILLRALWILYFDKDIKRLIRIWKKEEI